MIILLIHKSLLYFGSFTVEYMGDEIISSRAPPIRHHHPLGNFHNGCGTTVIHLHLSQILVLNIIIYISYQLVYYNNSNILFNIPLYLRWNWKLVIVIIGFDFYFSVYIKNMFVNNVLILKLYIKFYLKNYINEKLYKNMKLIKIWIE